MNNSAFEAARQFQGGFDGQFIEQIPASSARFVALDIALALTGKTVVDLAIKIAAFLFLAGIAMVIILLFGKYIVAGVLLLAAGVLVIYLMQDGSRQQTESESASAPAPRRPPAGEIVRTGPPVFLAVPGGSARIVAVVDLDPQHVRVLTSFHGDRGERILVGTADPASLLRPAFCLHGGFLSEFRDQPERVTLVSYELEKRVAEQKLSTAFCN